MIVTAPPASILLVASASEPRVSPREDEVVATKPAAIAATRPVHLLLRAELTIEFDEASERFVQTLVDPANQSVLRRYPAENQLAFSRGINAYMTALSGPRR